MEKYTWLLIFFYKGLIKWLQKQDKFLLKIN